MSKYRCLFCREKIEEYADDMIDSYNPTEKQIKDSGEDITDSSYHWVICDECFNDENIIEKIDKKYEIHKDKLRDAMKDLRELHDIAFGSNSGDKK